VEARGHGDRPHAMSARWREPTRTAPAAPPVSTCCQPRDACGGADLRRIMSPRGLPRLPQQIPSRVPRSSLGDVRVSRGLRPLTCGALVSLLPVSGHIGGLETVLSPLHLPLPPTLAAESLHASCYNPHKDPLPHGAAAQCNRVLSLMGDHEG